MKYVSDLTAYGAYYAWGAGLVTNYYTPYPGGNGETYMDQKVLIEVEAIADALLAEYPNLGR